MSTSPDYDPRLVILHADMDAFYAAVEVLDDPSLRGKPLIIGHPGRRGVVSTASYEARKFGVHSAMPSIEARRRCPDAEWRPGRLKRYAEISRQIREVFLEFTPLIEPLSLDEAFLDVAGSLRLFGGAIRMAEGLRQRVREETGGLTVSVGVAENMFLAKLASDLQKPDGLTVIPAGRAAETLAPLRLEKLWGVGAKTASVLHGLGLKTIGDVVRYGEGALTRRLGERSAHHLWHLAQGHDMRRVNPGQEARSVSTESTFAEDLRDPKEIRKFLFQASQNVAETLRRGGLKARTVQLKVRTGSFKTWTRSSTMERPSNLGEDFYRTATDLFERRIDLRGEGVRLLGVGAQGLIDGQAPVQGDLFASEESPREQRTAHVVDNIRAALGNKAITRGRLIQKPGADVPQNPGDDDPGRIRKSDL